MDLGKLGSTLKKHEHRNTRARRLIYETLEQNESSMTPREIFESMGEDSGVDLVSIYRNLELFRELKLAHRFPDGRFSGCHHDHKQEMDQHLHFISLCVECGAKKEIPHHTASLCELGKKIKKACKDLQAFHEIVIQGHCPDCSG